MNTNTKELDFEINLLPVLSILAICICFLLTTAIWSRLGYIGINQAIGDEIPTNGKNPDTLFLKILTNGNYLLQWKSGETSSILAEKSLSIKDKSSLSWSNLRKNIELFVKKSNTKTVIVMPESGTSYGETMALLDQLKSLSLNIGLAPSIKGVK